jgi:hypothetical protein
MHSLINQKNTAAELEGTKNLPPPGPAPRSLINKRIGLKSDALVQRERHTERERERERERETMKYRKSEQSSLLSL